MVRQRGLISNTLTWMTYLTTAVVCIACCAAACPSKVWQVRCRASNGQEGLSRRQTLQQAAALAGAAFLGSQPAAVFAAVLPAADEGKRLCDEPCVTNLESKEMTTTASGLQYRDIVVGKGPQPITGYQIVVNYVAMTPAGRVFDSSLEKGAPYDIRVGTGQVIAGLDEGLAGMRVGGVRRLYIPGSLAFPKGVKAAAGR
eukprot:jgi/Chrzof1/10911/Cz05g16240.t1